MARSISFDLQQKQGLKQSQRLVMSPQMQQAIHLLQMPVMELELAVEAELRLNPVLEEGAESDESDTFQTESETIPSEDLEKEVFIDDNDFEVMRRLSEEYSDHFAESGSYSAKRTNDEEKLQTFLESSVRGVDSLFESLMRQAGETFQEKREMAMAEVIVGNLDESGFFTAPIEEIAAVNGFDLTLLEGVLEEIRRFDPPGIAAASMRDSMLYQLKSHGKQDSVAFHIIEKHYEDMLHNRIPVIQKSLKVTPAEIRQAIDHDIAPLDLHPGKGLVQQTVQTITADATILEENGELKVVMSSDSVPTLRFNRQYMRMLEDETVPAETKEYIKQKVMSGKWLMRNIDQRNDTIYRISEFLTKKQKTFFMNPDGQLVPLTMKEVASELGLHESTIARAVASKYVDCSRGLVPLRSFFTNAYVTEAGEDISSSTVKEALMEIIDTEDKQKPLSDEALSNKLKEKGIPCARRTVAKYRTQFGIGNTSQRRRYS